MLDIIFLIGFIVFSIILMLFITRILARGISIFAKPPINPVAFITAKLCAFSSCFFIPAGIVWPKLKWFSLPEWLTPAALVLFSSGIIIAIIAMKKLDEDLIFGLPGASINSLKTDGIFKLSRNPQYLGFILLIMSSCLITPNPVNFAAAAVALVFHHVIILREEDYLLSKLGNEYRGYRNATGRYLLII